MFVCAALAGLILFTLWFLGTKAYHFTDLQMAEFFVYFLLGIGVPGATIWVLMKRREWKENQRRYPPLVMSPARDESMSRRRGTKTPSCSGTTFMERRGCGRTRSG